MKSDVPGALIVHINEIAAHPDADRLQVLRFTVPVDYHIHGRHRAQVVVGPHYKAHTDGVWFLPGAQLPGWLAEEMWLGKGAKWFEVREFPIRGELSQGIFAGQVWRKTPQGPFDPWHFWKSSWRPGTDVSDFFGVQRPSSSAVEHLLVKQEVAAKTTEAIAGHAVEASGSTPAVGSN